MRVVPSENEAINETWISDRDRFSYTGINSGDRLTVPMLKRGGRWHEVDWHEALEFATTKLKDLLHQHSAKQIAALISPSSTVEEFYLLQKLLRSLGCHNIDHRLHQTDFIHQDEIVNFPGLGISLEDLQNQENIVLIGSNIQREQPIAGHRVRKASLRGCKISSVNVIDYAFNFTLTNKYIVKPSELSHALAQIAKALLLVTDKNIPDHNLDFLSNISINEISRAIAEQLLTGERNIILLGAIAQNHPEAGLLSELVRLIALLCGAKIGVLTEGANSAGAWLSGAIPHRSAGGVSVTTKGLNAYAAIEAQLKGYILYNVEPECDFANPATTLHALDQAEVVISLSTFKSPALMLYADVLLPIAPFAEITGTYINTEGRWQNFTATTVPKGDSRPGWKVLRVLGNLLSVPGFEYVSAENIRDELKNIIDGQKTQLSPSAMIHLPSSPLKHEIVTTIERITEWPLYRIDSLVRRAIPLQKSAANILPAIYLNGELANKLNVSTHSKLIAKQNGHTAILPVIVDEKIPDYCVFIPAGYAETAKLGASFGVIEIGNVHD